MGTKKQADIVNTVIPSDVVNESPEIQLVTTDEFVVIRDNCRVSDRYYTGINDPAALSERDFWRRVAKKHSHGEPVEVVAYDPKKHRIW